ncbi:hypothetical protein [Micromonospora costi]|uniref:Uncharacterized protein n=1 Tax=Micromonospora costi TaxID=1530042 RepID=A0A3B0AEX3_9ACTN|nr:hypothetical protein [Micromonospora costi]RKN58851.1 hypothetical protein D7193_10120 [Micromonospora costi]
MHNQPGAEPPVFVDRTGRRRRLTVIAGTAMGVGLLASVVLILAGLFFESPVPVPGWPDSRPARPIEAGLDGRDGIGTSPSAGPSPATTSTSPAGMPSRSPSPTAVRATTVPTGAARPTGSERPGQGDERRNTPKPSRSPGKPQ